MKLIILSFIVTNKTEKHIISVKRDNDLIRNSFISIINKEHKLDSMIVFIK
ncbi:hypothetical protein FACS1894190_06990 [Spirochaetia bacterium]|nr:hypothetical protein FACS1894190_06990 [Spirochaetia bacterium]